jgi:hypothetical protein
MKQNSAENNKIETGQKDIFDTWLKPTFIRK